MQLTARQLNRTLLQRQLLLQREPIDVVEGVRRLIAVQAQQAASPYLALWNRIGDFAPADLDAAFAAHRIVKASLLRITLHAVAADDHPGLHRVMQPALRGSRLGDRRFTGTGLTSAEADASLPDLLDYLAEPRTNAEVDAHLAAQFPDSPPTGIWWALRTYAPLIHAPGAHPWSYGYRPSYLAAPTIAYDGEPEAVMVDLARRYLAAYGPATPADLALFSTILRPPAKQAFAALAEELVQHTGPDGKPLWDLAEADIADPDQPAPPRLLGMWDNALLAHVDRSRLIPPAYKSTVIRRNGDVLPMVLVDGSVAGIWRPVADGIEVTAFAKLPRRTWTEIAQETAALTALLADREPLVFSRYGHWWNKIEGAEVTVL